MNEPREDEELESYLDGGSSESRAYAELGKETPPLELDAQILAEAERAVKVTSLESRRAPPFKAFAWAAIVVLSFSLVLNILFLETPQDPVAELESMAGRFDAPSAAQEFKDLEETVATARKTEPGRPEEAGIGADVPTVAAESRLADRQRLEARDQMAAESSDETFADELSVYEKRSNVGKAIAPAASPVAANVQASAGIDSDVQEVPKLAMQVVADYLSAADSEGRIRSLTVAAPDDKGPHAELTAILDAYEKGHVDEALAALVEFRDGHPEHPVSLSLKERGF